MFDAFHIYLSTPIFSLFFQSFKPHFFGYPLDGANVDNHLNKHTLNVDYFLLLGIKKQ